MANRQEKTKEQKEAEKRAAFALCQEKKKEKRRGCGAFPQILKKQQTKSYNILTGSII